MQRYPLEVADVFRTHWKDYLSEYGASVSFDQLQVKDAIISCRTARLGGHILECAECKHREQSYNSCRNRHCPKCQASKAKDWVDSRIQDLLPVEYFHIVFTLPHIFNPLVLHNKEILYEILFKAVQKTLRKVAKNNYKCEIGFFSLLHTWGQSLTLHPHLHIVMPGAGISLDGKKVIPFKKKFFVADKILSSVFQGIFISLLKRAWKRQDLKLTGSVDYLIDKDSFESFIDSAVSSKWVVRTKPPFSSPDNVIKYLARYTHRVAISNRRLVSLKNGLVTFTYKDYKDEGKEKLITLKATEFIRRFFLHLLPASFVRIRHSGLLSNSRKKEVLLQLKLLLVLHRKIQKEGLKVHRHICPLCTVGTMAIVASLPPIKYLPPPTSPPFLSRFNTATIH